MNTVILSFDGSPGAIHAIEQAGRLFPGARAVVVSAWRRPVLYGPGGGYAHGQFSIPPDVQEDVERHAGENARELAAQGVALAEQAGFEAEPSSPETDGPVWSALLAAAEATKADAIVAGSRGFGDVKSLLLGSTSTALAHHSGLPVVIVPPPRHE